MGLLDDITSSFRRKLYEAVDHVSDQEAEKGWDDLEDKDMDNDGDTDNTDSYLYKRQSMVAKMDEAGLEEMSTTAGVPGYQTPKAFGDADDDTVEVDGWERAKETHNIFKPMGRTKRMEGKSSYKNMMSEMYGVYTESMTKQQAVNLAKQISKKEGVVQHVNKTSRGYEVSDWYDADETEFSFENGRPLNEAVSYRDYKRDESASPSQKVNKGIQEVNAMLAEIEKIVHNNLRLKTEMGVNSNQFWKKTSGRINKINERIVRISNKLKELSK